jgi:hypothetical protein
MLPIAFLSLLTGCLGLWSLGASVRLVFALALAAWVAFTFVLLPKLRSYQTAMGIDDELNAIEAKGWAWLVLRLKGLKVLILGFLTSMVPFLGSAAQWLSGQNLNFFFDPNNPKTQQTVMFTIGAMVFATPFVTSWLHSGAIDDAARREPSKPESKG